MVAARRLLVTSLAEWDLDDGVCNDGALAISELVTNSVLHARTAIGVRISRLGAGVRIEVRDGDPRIPVVEAARPEDLLNNRSMTGRGLALVAATADRWGADPSLGGKVVWAEVGTGQRVLSSEAAPTFPTPPPLPQVTAAARAQGVVTRSALTGGGRRIHLVGVPVKLLLESTRHLSDLQREMQVMAMDRTAPPEVEQVVQAGRPWITDIDQWVDVERRTAESALARGEETVDFDLVVPDDIDRRIDGIAAWMRRAASQALRNHLLTLPASDDVAAYRRWYSEEIISQMSGREPQPCPVRVRRPIFR